MAHFSASPAEKIMKVNHNRQQEGTKQTCDVGFWKLMEVIPTGVADAWPLHWPTFGDEGRTMVTMVEIGLLQALL